MKRKLLLIVAILFLCAVAARAQLDPGTLIIAGGGFAGSWDTEIELADSALGVGTQGSIFFPSPILGVPCPPACDSTSFTIPPKGTIRIRASDFIGEIFEGPHMLRVTTVTEQPLPVIHARIVNRVRSAQSAELPVLLESTLVSRNPSTLVFPGARRSPGVYGNLILQGLEDGGVTEVLIEIFSPDGTLLGTRAFTINGEGALRASTFVDVVGLLGVASLDGGQVRVTKTAGTGILWGVLATVYADGPLSVATGANP
jgi:hypothetical protein